MPPMPDLVKVSKLDTQFSSDPEYTQHIQYVSGNTLERRKLSKEERWTKERDLGQGSFGVVWLELCIHGDSMGKVRAVKKVQKIDGNNYHRELEAIALFSHHKYEECFVKSYGWYDTEDSIFITMEYLPNGDLHKYLGSPLQESEGQHIVSQVLEGLDFMHQFGFAHRDLKPANILVVSKRPNWWVKIADFGISKRATEGLSALHTLTGTPAFAAPEVLGYIQSESYTNAVDIWSLGVITFLLLTGETLFRDQRRLAQYVVGSFEFPLDTLLAGNISEQGCKFVRGLMAPDPKDRPGAKESRQNPWLDNLPSLTILEPLRTMKISESQEAQSLYSAAEASASWSALDQTSRHSSKVEHTQKADSGAFSRRGEHQAEKYSSMEMSAETAKAEDLNPTLTVKNSVNLGILTVLKGHSQGIQNVAFSPDSKMIASVSSTTVMLWDSATGATHAMLESYTRAFKSVIFSPDSKLIATSAEDGKIRIWDAATGATKATIVDSLDCVVFSPDSKLIATASSYDRTVRLWRSPRGQSHATLKGHSREVSAIAFSPDGKLIASASEDKTVRLWDPATGVAHATLKGHSGTVTAITFSLDGKLIASGSQDMIRLWDPAKGASHTTLEGDFHYRTGAYFSPDGKLVAAVSSDYSIRLWDSATGESHAILEGNLISRLGVHFSPDSKLIAAASGENTIRLWRSATGARHATLTGHSSSLRAVNFSPDGKLIASGAYDKTVRLWDSATGASLATLDHSGGVTAIAFSPDGRLIVSASEDMAVRVWGAIPS